MKRNELEMFEFRIEQDLLHIRPGGTYNMVTGRGYELDVAKLHLLQCYINSLIDHMCDCGELRNDYKAQELLDIAHGLYDGRFKDIIENFSQWKVEFNPGIYSVPAFLTQEPWRDISWHNDACPSFINWDHNIRVFTEATDPDKREDQDGPRFWVCQVATCEDGCCYEWVKDLYECDTEDSLVHFLENYDHTADKPELVKHNF